MVLGICTYRLIVIFVYIQPHKACYDNFHIYSSRRQFTSQTP
jgi:hypothetical protein